MSTKSKEPKAEEAKTLSMKAQLSGPGVGPGQYAPCKIKIPGNVLHAAGFHPRDLIEISVAGEGVITIRRTGAGESLISLIPDPKNPLMDRLMEFTREREAEMKATWVDTEPEEVDEGPEAGEEAKEENEGLDSAQTAQEAL